MRRQLALQFALAAALGFGGLLTLPVMRRIWRRAGAGRKEKGKTSNQDRRSEVLAKRFKRIEEAQILMGEEKYAEAMVPLQAVSTAINSNLMKKPSRFNNGLYYAGQGIIK